MDEKRAREIAASPVMANVTFQGMPVYIETVNRVTANIHPLNRPGKRQIVLLKDLHEH